MKLIDQIKKEIHSHQLVVQGDTIVVGVSGGADSVALLLAFNYLQHEYGLRVIAAHFDHNLRRDSKKDQLFVQKLCQKLNIKFVSKGWKVSKRFREHTSEDLAREHRFKFFLEVVKKYKADSICLAHTLDDVAETVLMRVLRGSGLAGLRSIMPVRCIKGVKVIRPLIRTQRKDIESFLKFKRQTYCQDPTNLEDKYYRNKIRLNLIPLLQKIYSSQIKELLVNLADSVGIDYDYLESCAQKMYAQEVSSYQNKGVCFKIKALMQKPRAIRRMMIRLAAENIKGNLNQITLKHMLEVENLLVNRPVGSIVDWPGNIFFKKEKLFLILSRRGV